VLDVRLGEEGCCDSEWLGPGSTTDKKLVDKLDKDKKNSPLVPQLGQNQTGSCPSGERIRGTERHPSTTQVRSESFFKSYEMDSDKVMKFTYPSIKQEFT
jgi:hypothetical protein